MRIGLLSGALPPEIDGIGDYTWNLGQEFKRLGHEVTYVTGNSPQRAASPSPEIHALFDRKDAKTFLPLANNPVFDGLDWLILQYNPFSFGPRGLNPNLPRVLKHLKAKGIKIAVMFHETYVPSWPWRFFVMRLWQYPQFSAICQTADCAFVSTERWLPAVREVTTKLPLYHAPVGSNLPHCLLTRAEAKTKIGAAEHTPLVGLFGTAHVSRALDFVGDAAAEIQKQHPNAALAYVGRDGAAVEETCKGIKVLNLGPLDAEEAAIAIRAMDVMISPFTDGISTRRTSVITALQQGTPLCTTSREWTDKLFSDFPAESFRMSPAEDKAAFITNAVAMAAAAKDNPEAGADLRAAFETHFSWPSVAGTFLHHLEAPATVKA